MAEVRNCEQCGAPFTPRREHGRFCSARCRVAWNRARLAGPAPEASALQWSITAMLDTTERLPRIRGLDRPRAFAVISEAVWWVTIVDGTLVKSPLNGTQTTVCKFAQDLRMQLWSEHLAGNLQETDPIKALKYFPGTQNDWPRNEVEAQKRKHGHIQCYVNVPGADLFVGKGWPNILDPNERHFKVV